LHQTSGHNRIFANALGFFSLAFHDIMYDTIYDENVILTTLSLPCTHLTIGYILIISLHFASFCSMTKYLHKNKSEFDFHHKSKSSQVSCHFSCQVSCQVFMSGVMSDVMTDVMTDVMSFVRADVMSCVMIAIMSDGNSDVMSGVS
jgi:hypothetical protein